MLPIQAAELLHEKFGQTIPGAAVSRFMFGSAFSQFAPNETLGGLGVGAATGSAWGLGGAALGAGLGAMRSHDPGLAYMGAAGALAGHGVDWMTGGKGTGAVLGAFFGAGTANALQPTAAGNWAMMAARGGLGAYYGTFDKGAIGTGIRAAYKGMYSSVKAVGKYAGKAIFSDPYKTYLSPGQQVIRQAVRNWAPDIAKAAGRAAVSEAKRVGGFIARNPYTSLLGGAFLLGAAQTTSFENPYAEAGRYAQEQFKGMDANYMNSGNMALSSHYAYNRVR